MKIIKYEDKYRDDMIFMILEAKNTLGRELLGCRRYVLVGY